MGSNRVLHVSGRDDWNQNAGPGHSLPDMCFLRAVLQNSAWQLQFVFLALFGPTVLSSQGGDSLCIVRGGVFFHLRHGGM